MRKLGHRKGSSNFPETTQPIRDTAGISNRKWLPDLAGPGQPVVLTEARRALCECGICASAECCLGGEGSSLKDSQGIFFVCFEVLGTEPRPSSMLVRAPQP